MLSIQEIVSTSDSLFSEVIGIYETSFPANERQSVELITERFNLHKYQVFVGFQQSTVVAFAFLYHFNNPKLILLDYIAVKPEFRTKGVGSQFLQELIKRLKLKQNRHYIIGEVENPEFGENKEERRLRLEFYSRLGIKTVKRIKYILPPLSGTIPTDMLLMIHPTPKPGQYAKKTFVDLITELYVEKYNRAPDDELLKKIIMTIPEKIEYI